MTPTARHILNVICLREGLPVDGWEHYHTSIGDDGVSCFAYDRDPVNDVGAGLVIKVSGESIELDRDGSWLDNILPKVK